MVKRLVVIGAGISGLAAASAAADAGIDGLEIIVLEQASQVGGKALSLREGPWLVEAGPSAYLDGEPALEYLVSRAGLEDERLVADESAANRFIVRKGRLRRLSPHPLRFARSGLLGPTGLARLLAEPFIPRGSREESVWRFAQRRLGRQVADRLVAPMLLGVFAGDARRLSLAAAFPMLAELEKEHGSLTWGLLRRRRGGDRVGPTGPSGKMTSFRSGMQALSIGLARSGGFAVRCNSGVAGLRLRRGGGWQIEVTKTAEVIAADAVALACEAGPMAKLLADQAPAMTRLLHQIPYPPVAVVALGFGAEAQSRVPRGFGALIPREEGFRVLGCLFDSHIFPGRSPATGLLIRSFLGGTVDPETASLDDDDLAAVARGDVARLLGLREPPLFTRVVRWERAIPQYEIGHLERVAAIEDELSRLPGLFLAGNALHGIAYPKAAATGVAAGKAAAVYLRHQNASQRS